MNEVAKINRALDETLVNLGAMVLRLAHPAVTKTPDERNALIKSVHQFAICAGKSDDPRVHQLRARLDETIRPQLKLVWSNEGVTAPFNSPNRLP
jgi:hypothetical protein